MEPTGKKILVVDDERPLVETICGVLTDLGYKAVGEENALSAVEAIERENPDLVTLDMIMPGATGIDVLKAMRGKGIQVPVIIISGFMKSVSQDTLADLGVRHTIMKPFHIEELQEKVQSVLAENQPN